MAMPMVLDRQAEYGTTVEKELKWVRGGHDKPAYSGLRGQQVPVGGKRLQWRCLYQNRNPAHGMNERLPTKSQSRPPPVCMSTLYRGEGRLDCLTGRSLFYGLR
jgi:hypothetical protein